LIENTKSKVKIVEANGKIAIEKPRILDFIGSGADKMTAKAAKCMLDEMRSEDHD